MSCAPRLTCHTPSLPSAHHLMQVGLLLQSERLQFRPLVYYHSDGVVLTWHEHLCTITPAATCWATLGACRLSYGMSARRRCMLVCTCVDLLERRWAGNCKPSERQPYIQPARGLTLGTSFVKHVFFESIVPLL